MRRNWYGSPVDRDYIVRAIYLKVVQIIKELAAGLGHGDCADAAKYKEDKSKDSMNRGIWLVRQRASIFDEPDYVHCVPDDGQYDLEYMVSGGLVKNRGSHVLWADSKSQH